MQSKPIRAALARGTRAFTARLFGVAVVPVMLFALWHVNDRFQKQFGVTASMADSIYSMSIVCDRKGRVVYANRRAEEYTGYTHDELMVGGVTLLIPPELERTHAVEYAEAAKSPKIGGSPLVFHGEFCTKTPGERVPAVFSIAWIEVDGEPYAHSIVLPERVLRSLLEVK
jgi:PAS domain S-box-containing protein